MRSIVTQRLPSAAVAAALVLVGILLATRPVSDERLRAQATYITVGNVVRTRTTWDGSQLLTVGWQAPSGRRLRSQLEDFNASPSWQVGDLVTVSFDPGHPDASVVLTYPSWSFTADFRADAVFQAVVPFTLAGIVLALAVIWPAGPWLFGDRARRARRSLRRYVLTPAVLCCLAVAGAVLIQDQQASAYSRGADKIVGWLSVVLMLLLIWPYVRAVQYYRLRRLLTVPDDAVDNAAMVSSVAGRRLQLGDVRMRALAGQGVSAFQADGTVKLYGRWERRGPALITDGQRLLIGFARRQAPVPDGSSSPVALADQRDAANDVIAGPLISQYPQLAREPRLLLVQPLLLLVIVIIGSIAVLANAGKGALGPLWISWILYVSLMIARVTRYRQFSRLLRLPRVASNGVVTGITRSWRGASAPVIAMSAGKTVRLRLIGERQAPWLAEGQDVVLLQLPTMSGEAVVLAAASGQAALAIARNVQVQDATAARPSA